MKLLTIEKIIDVGKYTEIWTKENKSLNGSFDLSCKSGFIWEKAMSGNFDLRHEGLNSLVGCKIEVVMIGCNYHIKSIYPKLKPDKYYWYRSLIDIGVEDNPWFIGIGCKNTTKNEIHIKSFSGKLLEPLKDIEVDYNSNIYKEEMYS